MWLKWMGAALVLTASPGLGLWMAGRWQERLKQMEQLRQMIYFLRGEIVYSHAPLAEALERVGRRGGGPLGGFFEGVSRRILEQKGESLSEIWDSELKKMEEENRNLAFRQEDLAQLQSLGKHLGYLDVDMQERMLLLSLEQTDLTISYLREHKREKCRLYASMGVMGGIFLVIIMF